MTDYVWIEGQPEEPGFYQVLCPPLLPHLDDCSTRRFIEVYMDPRSGRLTGFMRRATHYCGVPWPRMPEDEG